MRLGPWTARQLAVWAGLVGAAATVWLWSWSAAAGTPRSGDDTPFPALAVAAAALASASHVAWIALGRRAVGTRLAHLLGTIEAGPALGDAAPTERGDDPRPIAGKGLRHYHRPSCPMAAGRGWRPATPARHASLGRQPCGVCEP